MQKWHRTATIRRSLPPASRGFGDHAFTDVDHRFHGLMELIDRSNKGGTAWL